MDKEWLAATLGDLTKPVSGSFQEQELTGLGSRISTYNKPNEGGIMTIHATKELQAYWKENLTIISVLLGIWFVVSYVCGIMIANQLDAYRLGGFPLGFWFANQGSLVTFVALIWVYVWLMDRLDEKYDVHEN